VHKVMAYLMSADLALRVEFWDHCHHLGLFYPTFPVGCSSSAAECYDR